MDKVRIGIIGVGNMGSAHAQNICARKIPCLELTAVADTSAQRRDWAAQALAGVAVFDDACRMMDSGLVDAVLVATPHYLHPQLAIEGFQRGLHVMVEKPAGVYTKQVLAMNRAAQNSGAVFGMMFNQRCNPIYRKMRELVQGGTLGAIKRTNWIITNWYRPQVYYESGAWRATWSGEGGGVLLNQCPHNLDLWQWICGMPVCVDAHMHFGLWHNIEVEDDVTAYVEYPNGATGVFVTSTGDTPGTNRFEITLEKGKLVAEDDKLLLWELAEREADYSRHNRTEPFGTPPYTFRQVDVSGDNPQHLGVLKAFTERILFGTPLVAGGEEGIHGLTLSNAMHLSDWLGRPVTLPLDDQLFYEELQKRVAGSRRKAPSETLVADLRGSF